MSFVRIGSEVKFAETSDIVVEGRIESIYRGQIPGSEGECFGRFCIFAPGFAVLQSSVLGQGILNLEQSIGFWTPGNFRIAVGSKIRAYLIQAENQDNSILLIPNDLGHGSIVDVESGGTFLFHDEPIPTAYMPVKYGIYTTFRSPAPRIVAYKNDIVRAASMWKAHLPSYVSFDVFVYALNFAPPPDRHFDVSFGNVGATAIGRTFYWLPRKAPSDHALTGTIKFRNQIIIDGTEYEWSPPDSRASERQADFISTCAHEIGHSLGLDHTTDPGDVMYPSNTIGQVHTSLSANDIAAIQSLYP